MRYNDDRQAVVVACQTLDSVVYVVFAPLVERRCGLVEQQYVAAAVEGTRYAYSLALSARYAAARFAYARVCAVGQRVDELPQVGCVERSVEPAAVDLVGLVGKGYVLRERGVEDEIGRASGRERVLCWV